MKSAEVTEIMEWRGNLYEEFDRSSDVLSSQVDLDVGDTEP